MQEERPSPVAEATVTAMDDLTEYREEEEMAATVVAVVTVMTVVTEIKVDMDTETEMRTENTAETETINMVTTTTRSTTITNDQSRTNRSTDQKTVQNTSRSPDPLNPRYPLQICLAVCHTPKK